MNMALANSTRDFKVSIEDGANRERERVSESEREREVEFLQQWKKKYGSGS